MRANFKSALCGALCVGSVFAAPVDVLAGPASAPNQTSVRLPDSIDSIHYRRHYRHHPYRYGYRYDPSGAIFAGAALGMVAAGVAAATQPRYYGYPGYYGSPGYYGWGW
jgi:hypothetical protein